MLARPSRHLSIRKIVLQRQTPRIRELRIRMRMLLPLTISQISGRLVLVTIGTLKLLENEPPITSSRGLAVVII